MCVLWGLGIGVDVVRSMHGCVCCGVWAWVGVLWGLGIGVCVVGSGHGCVCCGVSALVWML